MVLVSGVIAFTKQIRYSMTGLQGIDPENIIVADLTSGKLRSSFSTICDEIGRVPGVTRTAGGSYIPPFENFLPVTLSTSEGGKVRLDGLIMGEGMSDLLGMELIEGEPFGPYKPGTVEVIINESSAKEHKVSAGEQLLGFRVKGIVKDFNAHSLHTPIQSVVILQQNPAMMGLVAIKTDGTNDEEVRKRIRELFAEISPDEIPEIKYLTDTVENFYSRERNQARIIGVFALLAAILSIMGLFGISMISILKRRKEIGLRKVNGASIMEVLLMVNTDFLKWVLLSALVSVPLSIFLLKNWLERFAYKTELSWWIFGLAGISAIIIAILTVSWQSIRAATSNPVDAIRYE
jgi:putative ABC transport system permease protein